MGKEEKGGKEGKEGKDKGEKIVDSRGTIYDNVKDARDNENEK